MNDSVAAGTRSQSLGEEIANSVSHGVGLVAAVLALPFLILAAARRGKVKGVFRVIDHSAIFLLIAGTYTPFTLGVLRGAWGWTLFALVWGLAALGVTLKAVGGIKHPRLSTALYLGMGWLALLAIRPLWLRVPASGLLWLVAGGVMYTAGVAFYAADRVRYGHFVWHLFTLAGTGCHFCAVLWYAV